MLSVCLTKYVQGIDGQSRLRLNETGCSQAIQKQFITAWPSDTQKVVQH